MNINMLALNICWSIRCQYCLFKQSCFFLLFFKLWVWPDTSSLLQHLEEHQSKHQVGLTRRSVLMEQEEEGTSTGFLVDSWDKLLQDGSCLKGTVKSRLIMVPKGAKWSFALELNWKLPPVVNSTLGLGGGYSEALSYAGSASPSCVSLLAGSSKSLIGWPHGSPISAWSLAFRF